MTTTVKEELAKVATSIEEALADQSKLEEFLEKDYKAIDKFIKSLDGKRGNKAITVEDAQELVQRIRDTISLTQVNARETHMLFLLMLQVSLLAQQDPAMKIDTSMQEALGKWFELWEAARSAWNKYTE